MSFLLYIVGFIVFISGLAWMATLLGLAQAYVNVGAAILLGLGAFTAVVRSRRETA